MDSTNDYGKWVISLVGAVGFYYFANNILYSKDIEKTQADKESNTESNIENKVDATTEITESLFKDGQTDSYINNHNLKTTLTKDRSTTTNVMTETDTINKFDEDFEKLIESSLITKPDSNKIKYWLF